MEIVPNKLSWAFLLAFKRILWLVGVNTKKLVYLISIAICRTAKQ